MTPHLSRSTSASQRTSGAGKQPGWAGKQVLVYGWGRSGRAVTDLLLRHGCQVLAVDDAHLPEVDANCKLLRAACGRDLEQLPDDVELVVPSPGVPSSRPLLVQASQRGVPIRGELEIAGQVATADLVAITGSNGKSTTTELTGALLRGAGVDVAVCGNIGTPLSACVAVESPRTLVVEVSSFQLETVDRFRPRVAALLNLSDDHLDRHGTFAAYAQTKQRLFARQCSGDVAVLNADDRRVASTVLPADVRRRLFSRLGAVNDGAQLLAEAEDRIVVLQPGCERVVRLADLGLRGEHNAENVLAACAVADAYLEGRQRPTFASTLIGFRGLPHRLQQVAQLDGVDWFDDSKGTNTGATIKSLEGFADGTVHLILGGQAKGADFGELRPWVSRKTARVYLIGEARTQLEEQLGGAAPEIEVSETLERAVQSAFVHAEAGQAVLLSPACASFDQFRDYAHRGAVFAQLVEHHREQGKGKPQAPKGGFDG